VGALGAVGRLGVAADLDLQDLQRRAELRLEEDVEQLAALRLLVVDEQPAGGAAAGEAAEAPEPARARERESGQRNSASAVRAS
jgi:hypothetical protein